MKLKRLKIKNIRSYETLEVEFPEGSLLLSGDIGSGKTSLLLAIEYALFGLQPGQKGTALLRNESNLGEVLLEFEVEEKTIIIERRLKRSNKGVSNEYAAITLDGEKIESSVTEVKTKVLEVLGYPPEFIKKNNLLYRYTVFTPQEQMKKIISEDPETRLNIIRNVFGIDKYRRIRENLDIVLSHLKENIKFLQGEIKTIDEDKKDLLIKKENIETLRSSIPEKEENLKKSISERQNIEKSQEELELKIKEKAHLETEVEKSKILLRTKLENLSSINGEISEIEKSLLEDSAEFNEERYKTLLDEINSSQSNLENLNKKLAKINSNIDSLEISTNENLEKRKRIFKIDICPTCLQDVPESHKHNILSETESQISKVKSQISDLEKERERLTLSIDSESRKKDSLEKEKFSLDILRSRLDFFSKSKSKLSDLTKTREKLESDLKLIEKHISGLKEDIFSLSKFDNQFKHSLEKSRQIQLKERRSEIELAELRKEIELEEREIKYISSKIEKKEISKKKLSQTLELNDWLSTKFNSLIEFTERNILMNLRIEFSNLFGKWFNVLVPNESFQVQIDESFSPIIINRETEMEYSFLSGGERTAVALAYRLALNQTINSILSKIRTKDIVILDEPTDGFSETQINKIRDIFSELDVSQLILVSHEQKIESFVENIVRIKKKEGTSFIE